ncbi:hypothetical protein [Desulfocicer niacini]
MTQEKKKQKKTVETKVDPQRRMALESLPPHLREQMTPEEVDLFLHAEAWPETLMKKLEEFIVSPD